MKSLIKIVAIILAIPVLLGAAMLVLGFLAVNYDFWPPSCSWLPPIKQAQRACLFSKLDRAPAGTVSRVPIWVSVPEGTPNNAQVYFEPAVGLSVPLSRIGYLSYVGETTAKVGDVLKYRYRLGNDDYSAEKSLAISREVMKINDGVPVFGDGQAAARLPARRIINAMDTWSINYNFNFFEDTRKNLDNIMSRAKADGADELGVFSFIEAVGASSSDFVLRPVASPYKYFRDAAITAAEMKTLAAKGNEHGLKIVLHYNVEADYAKNFSLLDIGLLGKGTGGDAAEKKSVAAIGAGSGPKTLAWVNRWYDGLETVLVKWAGDAQAAGIYGLDVTPQYLAPQMAPFDKEADERMSKIIDKMRKVYQGKIFAYSGGNFGGLSQGLPEYVKKCDGIYALLPITFDRGQGDEIVQMKAAYAKSSSEIKKQLSGYKGEVYALALIPSYDGFSQGKPLVEFNDYADAKAAGYVANYQEQADAYQSLFEALQGDKFYKAIASGGYWYDDALDPQYADPLISMHFSIRNKPAEGVWRKYLGGE